ncbi:MAG: hypothetical protein ACYTFW_22480, partial [Planctomycetota bacterium]
GLHMALRRGEFPNLKNRPARVVQAQNAMYAEIKRFNAFEARQIKAEEKRQKERSEAVFRWAIVRAREGKLTDEQVKYFQEKGLLDGNELKAVYKFADEGNLKIVGNKDVYEEMRMTILMGVPLDDFKILKSFLSEDEDHINGDQTAELLELNAKSRHTNPRYKWAANQIKIQFQKGPFDFGSATVRTYQHLAISEFYDRVINGGEDPEMVMIEIINRYQDWRKKRRSGELVPVEYQDNPALIDLHEQQGIIGHLTANAWKILLRQQDIASQLSAEKAAEETTKTGGPQ